MSSNPATMATTSAGTATRNDWTHPRVSSSATKPKLLIISGPSGAGKSTVVRALLTSYPHLVQRSVSVTTRQPRPGEVPDVDYHFWTKEQFQAERERDGFLEYKEVFGRGDWYGTLRREVEAGANTARRVLLEIDVEGMKEVLSQDVDALTIFIHPGSMEELEKRLRARGTDTEDAIRRRLEVAQREMDALTLFQHEVINDDIDRAVLAIAQLLANQTVTDQIC